MENYLDIVDKIWWYVCSVDKAFGFPQVFHRLCRIGIAYRIGISDLFHIFHRPYYYDLFKT